jgi:hypothetical protein
MIMLFRFLSLFLPISAFGFLYCLSASAEPLSFKAKQNEAKIGQTIADRLVARGEKAFSAGLLILPDDNNAFNLFRAAQILEPDNEKAKAGLDAILIAEVERVKDFISSSKLRQAESRISLLKDRYKNNALLTELHSDIVAIKKMSQARERALTQKSKPQDPNRILLNETDLKAKSEGIRDQLAQLAENVSQSRQGVLIFARTDAQARWIYQQMRRSVPDYRIRGDLRIGPPRIELTEPYE